MIFVKLFSIFWVSISSVFSYGFKESYIYNESKVLASREILPKCVISNNSNRYLYSVNDILNDFTYPKFYSTNTSFFDNPVNGAEAFFGDGQLSTNCYIGTWNNVIWGDLLINNSFAFNQFRIQCTGVDYQSSRNFVHYQFQAYNAFNGSALQIADFSILYDNYLNTFGQIVNFHPQYTDYAISIDSVVNNGLYNLLFTDYNNGYTDGFRDGTTYGYDLGYSQGLVDANTDPVMNSIFNGIFQIGLLPVNVFLTMFNYDVFGINIAGLVSGFLTLSVLVIIIRFIFGAKSNDK